EVVDVRSHAVRGTVDRVPGSMNEVVAEPPVADDPACGVVQLVPLHVAACGECILDVLHCGLTGITHGLEDLARPRGNAVTQVRHPRLVGVYHVVGLLRPEVEENDIALLELRAAALELVVRVCGVDTVRGDGVGPYPRAALGEIGEHPFPKVTLGWTQSFSQRAGKPLEVGVRDLGENRARTLV